MSVTYDVAVIGGGVVGCAIARALTRFELSVALLEATGDVGAGTSKANTAIWHTGFDAPRGSLETRLLARSYGLLETYAEEVGIALERTGALLVAWTDEQRAALPELMQKAHDNGVLNVAPLDAAKIYAREPSLGPGALAGLIVPGEGILCPYTPPLAFATDAIANGAELILHFAVAKIAREPRATALVAESGSTVRARWVVNAAGLGSDVIEELFGYTRFTVKPRRGELIVFDKLARPLLRHVILPVPTKTTKGVLVAPTVFGNLLLGPTAEEIEDRSDTTTTATGLHGLLEKGRRILPALVHEEITSTYAGLRAATEHGDYQIHLDVDQRYVCAGGIRSTGLSAAMGIAEHIVELLGDGGAPLREKRGPLVRIRMPPLGQSQRRPYQCQNAIVRNPDYGTVICHCERVTRGELLDAMRAPLPAATLDGLRRRTRCLQGRCQGFYCLASIAALLSEETGQTIDETLGLLGAGEGA